MVNNTSVRQKVAEVQAQAKADREWWDRKRASIQNDFMKELDAGASASSRPNTSVGEKLGSDEDAVLVEAGGPAATGSATGGGKGGGKKRKGKK